MRGIPFREAMIKNKVYTLIRSTDLGYGIRIGPPLKIKLIDWDDATVRVFLCGQKVSMSRDLFEYLVYED